MSHRYTDLMLLHPHAIKQFENMYQDLKSRFAARSTLTEFRVFETYRSPVRQQELWARRPKVTRAQAWQSAHQVGLAVDFVPWHNGRWSWSEKHNYDLLKEVAEAHGLRVPMVWDRCHVEHPNWRDWRSKNLF